MTSATQCSAVGIMPSTYGHETYEIPLDFDANCRNSSKITYSSTVRRALAAAAARARLTVEEYVIFDEFRQLASKSSGIS